MAKPRQLTATEIANLSAKTVRAEREKASHKWFSDETKSAVCAAWGKGKDSVLIGKTMYRIYARPKGRVFIEPLNGTQIPCGEIRVGADSASDS
jgi:hypothetical protein